MLAAGAGCLGLTAGQPLLTGLWTGREVPVVGKLGTPQLFDLGVYLVVIGAVLKVVFSISEGDSAMRSQQP